MRIDSEEAKLKKFVMFYNSRWKKDEHDGDDNDTEVVVIGDIDLSQNERDVLNLGPDFMVVSPLDDKEMEIEATVTMTKLRWGRIKSGVDEMTASQEKNDHVPPTEEEESLDDALEAEIRDVMNNEGTELSMGNLRATDMKNNREVRMPPPAPPLVEAEHNTRVGTWRRSFKEYKKNECREDGSQKESNLTPGQ